ncbi:MAG: cell division protein SepF [Acidimicrobiia bacterium]
MTYLGLGPDDEYDDYDDVEPVRDQGYDRARLAERRPSPAMAPRHRDPGPDSDVTVVGVRRLEAQPAEPSSGLGAMQPKPHRSSPVVRPIPVTPNVKPHVVAPGSFNEAQEIADKYKGQVPVIINLQAVDRDLSRRIIDFASGLCYGLGGAMEKVAHQVYLLTPSNVELSAEERRRLQERGLYD